MMLNSSSDNDQHYSSALAVESAIKAAAKAEHARHPERAIGDIIRQTHYDRFLSRVFSPGDSSDWMLKGGSAMLARLPCSRRTLDADLFCHGYGITESLEDLKLLSRIDLDDFFRFEFRDALPIVQADNQPYTDGYRVRFDAYLGVKHLGIIQIDLVTYQGAVDEVEVVNPKNRIPLPKLVTYPYRLYPVTNQFADKVCAVIERVHGHSSTRVKDLVDLTILATTYDFSADALQRALRGECRKRRIAYPVDFHAPENWRDAQFGATAHGTNVKSYRLGQAEELIGSLVTRLGQLEQPEPWHWSPERLQWEYISPIAGE